jgi:hypothetical protein
MQFSIPARLFLLIWFAAGLNAATYMGTSSGIFDSPQPDCIAPVVCSGLGTGTISWGTGDTQPEGSILTFTPQMFDVDVGDTFVIGTLTLANRPVVSGSAPTSFRLQLGAAGFTKDVTMVQVGTANVGTPEENADYLYFLDDVFPDVSATSFFVLEESTASVELRAAIAGGILPFGLSAQAQLAPELRLEFRGFGEVSGEGFLAPNPSVPEPGTLLVVAAGLLAIGRRQIAAVLR